MFVSTLYFIYAEMVELSCLQPDMRCMSYGTDIIRICH